jgi:uncharacterized membrane protein YesL
MHFLRIDGPVFRFLETIANLLLLNLLFVICCIPVVTIGPALTATYYVALKIVRQEETGIFRDFFHSFRQNFKQGLLLGVGVILLAGLLLTDLQVLTYLPAIPAGVSKVLLVVTGLLLLILAMIAVYLFAVLAQFENTTKELIKWSAILVVRHLPVTVICLVVAALPILCMLFIPALFLQVVMPVMLLLGFAGIACIHAYFYVRVFAYYMPKEEEESEE